MTAARIQNFGGMVPAVDDRLLPDGSAAYARNAWLYSGALIGMVTPTSVYTAAGGTAIARVYRIPNNQTDPAHFADSTWLEFQNADTEVLRAPVVGDTFSRYYWLSPGTAPVYNTLARIKAGNTGGNAPMTLGVPSPGAPSVTSAGGSSSTLVSRSYVVTYLSAYGEEGPPSPASATVTGKVDDTWAVVLPAVGSGDTTNRNLVSRRVYRTITSSAGVATFFLVATLPLATVTYSDTQLDTAISGNLQLASTTYSAPPSDLSGWVTMPNGMIAGFRANEVWFAEPYRPHAWPAQYAVAVDYPIVGLGVVGQTLIICTSASPWAATGTSPASMTLSKLNAYEPCTSRGSIISAPEGVYYSSQNGLVLVSSGAVQNITKTLLTKDRWQTYAPLTTLRAARLGTSYYAFGSQVAGVFDSTGFQTDSYQQTDYTGAYTGVLLDTSDLRVAFMPLYNSSAAATSVFNDPWTGEVFIMRAGVVYWINTANSNPTYESYLWRSKVYQTQAKKNFSCARVYFDVPATTPALNPTRNTAQPQTLGANQYLLVRLYADGQLKLTREVRQSGELIQFPSGYMADFWQFEFEGRVRVYNAQMATSVKELASE